MQGTDPEEPRCLALLSKYVHVRGPNMQAREDTEYKRFITLLIVQHPKDTCQRT